MGDELEVALMSEDRSFRLVFGSGEIDLDGREITVLLLAPPMAAGFQLHIDGDRLSPGIEVGNRSRVVLAFQ